VAANGVYRISKQTLDAAGIGSAQAQHFQLWRNGREVALFTSVAGGLLGANDFIEFYGEKNDGAIDRNLYRIPAHHLTNKVSLFTDSAAYFLTINTVGSNLRYNTLANNAAGSPLTPAPYVWNLVRHDYLGSIFGVTRPYVNKGIAANYGEYVYSSAYDQGEMMSSGDIFPNQNNQDFSNRAASFQNLLPYTAGGVNGRLRISLAGSAPNSRSVRIQLNNNTVFDRSLLGFEARVDSTTTLSPALLQDNTTTVVVRNLSTNLNDRVVTGFVEIEYPRLPNAGGANQMHFSLNASASPVLVSISNFNHNNVAPVLLATGSNTRMVGILAGNGNVSFLLPSVAAGEQYVLYVPAATLTSMPLTARNFVNYSTSANQADYIIITNQLLLAGGANNPVEQYRQYRSSTTGGTYNARIFTVDQLVDQFAYGVKMHPLSIKYFLRFARQRFSVTPKFCFLIGKGVTYDEYRSFENHPLANSLNLVPTFGYPASDNLMASDDLTALVATQIGRLNVVKPSEVTIYLDKVKEYEQAQANPSQTQNDKAWMKNIVHVLGANDAATETLIRPYMDQYERIIKDTLFGASVFTFNKFNSTTATTIENEFLSRLFERGFSLLTYYGHSSATALDYNLDDPSQYNNPGKYPMFLLNGCNAGNFFTFDTARLNTISTISEKYLLAQSRGAIGMIASTHFGIVNGLGVYSQGFYRSVSSQSYNRNVGLNIRDAIQYMYQVWGSNDFSARIHTEQQTLHGDPAIRINSFAKPDYSIEQPNVIINPSFISIAETSFKARINYLNIGKATNDSIVLEVKRTYPASSFYPSGFTETVLRKKVLAPKNFDSLELTLPIFPDRDKGTNKLQISLDTENRVDELSELNNSISVDVVIFEDDLRPAWPYNFAIVNKQNIKLTATTSNPFSTSKGYRMEMDTAELFNSPFKITRNITSTGGVIEFDPGITFRDSTVYYWRVGVVPASGTPDKWNTSSFVYLLGTQVGFNQSHLYQHTKSLPLRLRIDSASRNWRFNTVLNNLFIQHSIYPTSGDQDIHFSISANNTIMTASACIGHSLIFNVFDPITFKPMRNYPGGAFGSGLNTCVTNLTRQYNFEWDDRDTVNRRKMAEFMDAIPNGAYVVVRKILDQPYDQEAYAPVLKADEAIYGSDKTLYTKLKNAGFAQLDSFNYARTFIFMYKKGDPAAFAPRWKMSDGLFDRIQMNENMPTPDTLGYITSPLFGPAKSWKQAQWRGSRQEATPGDRPVVELIGVTASGAETVLANLNEQQQDYNMNTISAAQYPFVKLRMANLDSMNGTPYNLRWWRLYYDPVPEGSLAANISLQSKDTLQMGEPLNFRIAFKNISEAAFDSLKLQVTVLDKNNVQRQIALPRKRPLIAGDTIIVAFTIETKDLPGLNTLYLAVNPDNDQPEQHFFNNFLYKTFYVREDKYNPLLDVTFDGVHILNRDIVSAKPHIQIKLKDENNFLALNDTAGLTIKLRFPGEQNARTYHWGSDTLRFTPAIPTGGDNTATVDFYPALTKDTEDAGREYELTVSGKDINNNRAGAAEYRVTFQVFNKPMISNLLNYPNPFSTSTAFVFTITGSEVPQEFKIQILSITGKIVREITSQELGPLRIGTNITEYKWDGTDTYGQKLANGVYLYRLVTSLNGQQMEKFRLNEGYQQGNMDVTDKYFNKGYGKMVILR